MGKPTGFMEFKRLSEASLPVADRRQNYHEFVLHLNDEQARTQGARCMDCGIPFLHHGLSGQQHHSGLERSGVSRQLARSAGCAAFHQ